MDQALIQSYTALLQQELKASLGCTEPIAIAYSAAYARKVLGQMPEHITVFCSGNVIKNAASVVVPLTGGMRGIEAAAAAGAISGRADLQLEVLTVLTPASHELIRNAISRGLVDVKPLETQHTLHIITEACAAGNRATVEIIDNHSQIGQVTRNGAVLHCAAAAEETGHTISARDITLQNILEYAEQVDLSTILPTLERQISYNLAVAQEGLNHPWGAQVGKTLMEQNGGDLRSRICASAAAASDARMNGCPLPVVINSGSGNQGITVSVPVAIYAEANQIPHDKMLRALCVANLTALKQKAYIGRLSAFCGALCAATAAVCAIAYLDGAAEDVIGRIIVNSLATTGGMFCDGAKSSCAGKIAVSLKSAFLAYDMAKANRVYGPYEGLVRSDVESTIEAIGRVGSEGMRETDRMILETIARADCGRSAEGR